MTTHPVGALTTSGLWAAPSLVITVLALRRHVWAGTLAVGAARAMLVLAGAMLLAMALARGPRGSTLVVAVPLLLLAGASEMAARHR